MARALKRHLQNREQFLFIGFPRQWIPVFELIGTKWSCSIAPNNYVPFYSGLDESQILAEVVRARSSGQLQFLVEVAASSDVVLCETFQRLTGIPLQKSEIENPTTLTTWLGYNRQAFFDLNTELSKFRARNNRAIFLPCSKARPYGRSQTFRARLKKLEVDGHRLEGHDLIVITSIGPIPEPLWNHPVVMHYDTGVRDIFRILVQLRILLKNNRYEAAIDTLPLVQYGDILDIASREGLLPPIERPAWVRRRNIPVYKGVV